jgi:SAM-dependent methyltransferase
MLKRVPDIFRDVTEYRGNSAALELAQGTFNEEALYRAIEDFAAHWYELQGRPASILDLCAASGLAAGRVRSRIPVDSIDLVDIDEAALNCAVQRLSACTSVCKHVVDAASFRPERKYDLVIANSAFHHIEDGRKVEFLKQARLGIAEDGLILLGEHFLPPYNSFGGFRKAVECFYELLIPELLDQGEDDAAIRVIRRSGLYCWEGQYEYKVSWNVFLWDIARADLKIHEYRVLWAPPTLRKFMAGTVAVALKPMSASG